MVGELFALAPARQGAEVRVMDERDAIACLKQGDIGGLEMLVERYQTRAVRVAYLVCRDTALAEDVVQSAFIRVFERIHQFDAARPFAPWFLRMVVNDTLNQVSRAARQTSLDEGRDDEPAGELVGNAPSPEDALEHAETVEAIAAVLDQLNPSQRAALVMRYYLNLNESEMAARLNISPGTVKWRLHNARQRMRQLLPAWLVGKE